MTESTTEDGWDGHTKVRTQSGDLVPKDKAVSLPGVGYVKRENHTPFTLNEWDSTIDEYTAHHMTGESTTYRTWLVGLDEVGRGVYHDERNKEILVMVPKYHHHFTQDVTGDERPFRNTPSKHTPGRGRIVDSPDNGVLAVVNRIDTESDDWSKRSLAQMVAENADDWTTLTEKMCDYLEKYTLSEDGLEESAEQLIEQHRD